MTPKQKYRLSAKGQTTEAAYRLRYNKRRRICYATDPGYKAKNNVSSTAYYISNRRVYTILLCLGYAIAQHYLMQEYAPILPGAYLLYGALDYKQMRFLLLWPSNYDVTGCARMPPWFSPGTKSSGRKTGVLVPCAAISRADGLGRGMVAARSA